MSKGKRLLLTDSSLNRYGFRILTEGIRNLEAFKKNPVMLYMHFRDEGSPYWGESKAIGHWEDIQIEGDQLSAVPVFDCVDELSQTVAKKFEAGTFNAASVGIRIIATSENRDLLVPGQTRATVTEWDLMEASIVDIPANENAVRLYAEGSMAKLAASFEESEMPALIKKTSVMNLKATWMTVLAFLGIAKDKAESTQLSEDNMASLDAEMKRLQDEVLQLKADKTKLQGDLDSLRSDIQDKDNEIGTLKSGIEGKDTEIQNLKTQVENLKQQPSGGAQIAPKNEPEADKDKDTLAAACADESNDIVALAALAEKEGL